MEREFSNNRMMHKYPKYLLSRSRPDCRIAEMEKPMHIPLNAHDANVLSMIRQSGRLDVCGFMAHAPAMIKNANAI